MINAIVICEYNPFHLGHLRQLELIRARLGSDVTITAVMSGNYVQRGELACAPKYERAAVAVRCGCDLVLELPHPWSCSSAEFFARAAVSLADALGVYDVLCFGCESVSTAQIDGSSQCVLSAPGTPTSVATESYSPASDSPAYTAIPRETGAPGAPSEPPAPDTASSDTPACGLSASGAPACGLLHKSDLSGHGKIIYTPEEAAAVARFREYLARRGSLESLERPERVGGSKLRAAEALYREKYGENAFYPVSPNDILAAEYIDALDRIGSNIVPVPLLRIRGLSATASRAAWERGDWDALGRLVPPETAALCRSRSTPVSSKRLGAALPLFFRLADPSELAKCCDADGGLAERLCAAARKSISAPELYENALAKHLTRAKIRRAALNCLLGVTYDEVGAPPPYTSLLAANSRGTALLREIKKRSRIPVVTKPADYRALPPGAKCAFERCARADGIYMLACGDRGDPLTLSPVILPDA